MERLGGEHEGQVSSVRQVAIASSIGTALEWYDYFLYGTAAALIFNQLFFPEAEPLVGTLLRHIRGRLRHPAERGPRLRPLR